MDTPCLLLPNVYLGRWTRHAINFHRNSFSINESLKFDGHTFHAFRDKKGGIIK